MYMILIGFGRWKGFLPSGFSNNENKAIGKTLKLLLFLNSENSKTMNWNNNMGMKLHKIYLKRYQIWM